jgi:hypothetical protein
VRKGFRLAQYFIQDLRERKEGKKGKEEERKEKEKNVCLSKTNERIHMVMQPQTVRTR